MTEPKTNRWLRTRVPGKLGILIAALVALVAGYEFYVFIANSSVLYLVFAVLIFALAGWSLAAAVTKLRQEPASER
jgi:hypothetical protein